VGRVTDFVGTGWRFPLGVGPGGAVALAGGAEKIEQAIRLILTTYPGERPMRPEFGSRLRDHVFGPASHSAAADLTFDVREALLRWEPRIDVEQVETYPSPDQEGLLYLDISYTVKATNDRRNLVFPFYRIPENEQD
jgi:phage baseplate assembly protein W